MPGAVPRTSTLALNNVTLPYALDLAGKGLRRAVLDDPGLLAGVNTHDGKITCQPVAESQDRQYTPLLDIL
jgi:alanine dehydrogenase